MEKIVDSSRLKVVEDWNLIWKLQIPLKVKLLVWWVSRDCIPTHLGFEPLRSMGIECPSNCVQWSVGLKNAWHIFSCEESQIC